jgi:hypothetical protein
MKKLLFIVMAIFAITLSSCTIKNDSNEKMAADQEGLMQEANRQIGMPAIKNFQERKLAKMIFELRDRSDLICYAYIVNQMTGKFIYLGKCIGYGLPYSTQYTNPQKVDRDNGSRTIILPQADPNGLFMPEGVHATWIMLIDKETGKPKPVYVEPDVIVSPIKL